MNMKYNEFPTTRAFYALMESSQGFGSSNVRRYALTWLAAARMLLSGKLPHSGGLGDLNTTKGWLSLQSAGLPIDAVSHLLSAEDDSLSVGLRAKAVAIVAGLKTELGQTPWDVLPSLGSSRGKGALDVKYEGEPSDAAMDLLLELAGSPSGTLWLPFDNSGVMTIKALRRGWLVNAVQMLESAQSDLPLLLAIEFGQAIHPDVSLTIERAETGVLNTRADVIIANPPFGMPMGNSKLNQWSFLGDKVSDSYARSDAWVVNELVNRATRRSIFLVSPGLLFTRGQEQRLREYLVHRGGECNELEAVIALPTGALAQTKLACSILVVNPRLATENVRMVDLGSASRTILNVDEVIRDGTKLCLGVETNEQKARTIRRQDILNSNECVFTPSRYIRQSVDPGPNAVALDQLFDVIRPPAVEKEGKGCEALEVGLPELGQFRDISGSLAKQVTLKAKVVGSNRLVAGDVVLSTKGTVGKCGIFKEVDVGNAVLSQSCVGLRAKLRQEAVTPQYLLMYLRSQAGQAQLIGLQVGAGVQHVSVATLMSSYRVPVPSAEEHDKVVEDYEWLCSLEHQAAEIEQQMATALGKRWTI